MLISHKKYNKDGRGKTQRLKSQEKQKKNIYIYHNCKEQIMKGKMLKSGNA